MYKFLTLALVLLLSNPANLTNQDSAETYVYICTGKYAYSYHSTNTCSGLNKCKAEIRKVTVGYAKQIGRKPCEKCY